MSNLQAMSKLPVLSVEQMRQWESASWAAGKSEAEVIANVGHAAARRLQELTTPGDTVWILAGKGHNGDDARAMLPHLPERNVLLTNVAQPAASLAAFPKTARWIVDGLFGIGLNRPLEGEWRGLIDAINQSGVPIFSLDVPSGLNADSGEAEGVAVKAALTLTVGAPKTGLLRASEFTGRLEVAAAVGLIPCPFSSELNWTLPEHFIGLPLRRLPATNKGTFGHATLIAGSRGYHGAAVLAARGALRARPGLVTVFPMEAVYLPVAAQLQSAMVQSWEPLKALPKTCSALLFGPGLAGEDSNALKQELRAAWHGLPLAMVVDASALDWLQSGSTPPGSARVLTPHPGEAGRLLNCTAAQVQSDRVAALREISRRFGDCCVVLKGNQTLVGHSTGDIFINSSGDPFLAQGGTGDLLAGYLTGLLAQPDWRKDPLLAVRYAVWQHGASADHLSTLTSNWTVEDLEKRLGRQLPAGRPA